MAGSDISWVKDAGTYAGAGALFIMLIRILWNSGEHYRDLAAAQLAEIERLQTRVTKTEEELALERRKRWALEDEVRALRVHIHAPPSEPPRLAQEGT